MLMTVLLRVLVEARAGRHVAFAAYDRLDAGALSFLEETHRAEHYAVVRYGYRIHAKLAGPGHQFVYAAGSVEKAVFGMYV